MCTSPLHAVSLGLTKSGKKDIYFLSGYSGSGEYLINGVRKPVFDRDLILIPCGQCVECRLNYARQWANRCMLEAKYHSSNYFVTLTYDNDHLYNPEHMVIGDDDTIVGFTLLKRDLQLFFKRLRKHLGDKKIRFFASGEYGDTYFRPHYHAIIFGLELNDLLPDSFRTRNFRGDLYFESPTLTSLWGKGHVTVAEFSWDCACYVARYVMKKQKGVTSDFYSSMGLLPEFSLMSRKPGIGRQFYEDNKDEIFLYDSFYVGNEKESREIKSIFYYDRLFDIDFPEDSAILKSRRKWKAEQNAYFVALNNSKNVNGRRDDKRKLNDQKFSKLKRGDF